MQRRDNLRATVAREPRFEHPRDAARQRSPIVRSDRASVSVHHAQAIGPGQARKIEAPQLNQITQISPPASDCKTAPRPFVIEQNETRRYSVGNKNVEGRQIAVDKTRAMEPRYLLTQRAQ